jgi:hypothetical protein
MPALQQQQQQQQQVVVRFLLETALPSPAGSCLDV